MGRIKLQHNIKSLNLQEEKISIYLMELYGKVT